MVETASALRDRDPYSTPVVAPPARPGWGLAFCLSIALLGILGGSLGWVLLEGVGVWGNNVPVTWALDIVGYDWWIGVACGNLLFSAILLLCRAEGGGLASRLAETASVLGVAAAGLYPIVHLGRPWFFYWNLPYPNTFLLWPQMRSPLYWDAIDIVSFVGVGLCLWFTGLLPDLARLRDRSMEAMAGDADDPDEPGAWFRRMRAQAYGVAALGWRGSATHWGRWLHAYRALAVLGIVLVVSLQTGAAVMFAGTPEPGWHDAMLPVSDLFGAALSGVAVLGVLMVAVRHLFALEGVIGPADLERLGLAMLGLSLLVLYGHLSELIGLLDGDAFERAAMARRFAGGHAWAAWTVLAAAIAIPQALWLGAVRRSAGGIAWVGGCAAFGIWAEHFMLIVDTLQHDFLPSAAHPYAIGAVGVSTFLGTIGLFGTLLLLCLRVLPPVSMFGLRPSPRTGMRPDTRHD